MEQVLTIQITLLPYEPLFALQSIINFLLFYYKKKFVKTKMPMICARKLKYTPIGSKLFLLLSQKVVIFINYDRRIAIWKKYIALLLAHLETKISSSAIRIVSTLHDIFLLLNTLCSKRIIFLEFVELNILLVARLLLPIMLSMI